MDVTVTQFGSSGPTPRKDAAPANLHRALTPAPTSPAPAPPPASATASRAAKIARLSAGVVPGGVSFDPAAKNGAAKKDAVASQGGSMALHAAPADRNTAATGVALGRVIDVTV